MESLFRSVKTSRFSINGRISSDLATSVLANAMTESIPLGQLIKLGKFDPLSVATSLAVIGLESNDGLGPTLKTSRPLDLRWKPFLVPEVWSEILVNDSESDCLNLSSALLQIFDFWEESHQCAQAADDKGEKQVSAHWHAICHRREPDAGNANYWWARVRNNRVSQFLVELLAASQPELTDADRECIRPLINRGKFDERTMVSNTISVRSGSAQEKLLRKIQKYEMIYMFGVTIDLLHRSDTA